MDARNLKKGERPPLGAKERVIRLAGERLRPTNREIIEDVQRKYGITISERTVGRYCDAAGVPRSTRKLPVPDEKGPQGDQELGPHGRELFYFGQGLRDLVTVPSPQTVVEEYDEKTWASWPSALERPRRDLEEEEVARHWGFSSCNAEDHPLFQAFRQHLHDQWCWATLARIEEAFRMYREVCRSAYQAILEEIKKEALGIPDGGPEVMAISPLADGLQRKQTGTGLRLSYGPRKDGQPDRLGYEVTYGAQFLIVDNEALAQRMTSVLQKLMAQLPLKPEFQALRVAKPKADQAKAEFQAALSPDALLRKLVLNGHCEWCP